MNIQKVRAIDFFIFTVVIFASSNINKISYYNYLNKPWFAFPAVIYITVWAVSCLSFVYVTKYLDKHNMTHDIYNLLVAIISFFFMSIYSSLMLQIPLLLFVFPFTIIVTMVVIMYKVFQKYELIAKFLVPLFIILLYYVLVGLYIVMNN